MKDILKKSTILTNNTLKMSSSVPSLPSLSSIYREPLDNSPKKLKNSLLIKTREQLQNEARIRNL